MNLSIVATLYKSAAYVEEFHRRASAAARELAGDDYEIVLVNDGSPDDSLDRAVELTRIDRHVTVIDLSRNFGHHKAMVAGLAHARGERIFLIDSDLEEAPEWLRDFAKTMAAEASDVVYGVQEVRKGNWFERWSGELYYTVFNYLAHIDHPRNIVTARLMSRRYVDALLQFREREMVISCLWVITGFKQSSRTVKKLTGSPSTYSLTKKIAHATNAITSFSEAPLRMIFYVGLAIFAGALLYAAYLVFHKLVLATPMDGWTSVMVSIWLLGGMIVSFLGVIGIYLSKIFTETKQRPFTIVRDIHGQSSSIH
ncbi:glycosyltransferase family 2 protein [Variovorax saccharolyticus]|uniref:glycosyltransferase family 2 protein n=1 Tax=Variovorax saccharolyticus TaxID=3053516 RepID=UPI0025758A6A|nr:glycosyltransferase family 2 protein [Variovorax sp. J31P216]MDM0028687.1 glycosyltransferase family 2 protein [Variovorax sp. J31P216]